MNCPQCQKVLREGAQFCTNCGLRTLSGRDPLAESVATVGAVKRERTAETGVAGDPMLGRVLDGKYEIGGRLGEGGMGTVYRARRVHIGDEVALKVLHSKFLADASAVERFRREARAAAQLNHPNVVTIHDYGETPAGADAFAYIVMELVRGESLRALLKSEQRLAPVRAVGLMRDICAGVGAAHRRNIVHRDIKPDNIIVLAADDDRERETVKVVDFGIAKLRDMASENTLTQTGVMVGTPYYMSPEQCRGESLDTRADVYSLGALLYEMLAGSPPFTAPSVTGVIAKHLTEPPPGIPPELRVPRALEAVIMRSLAKDPEGRQADATVLARELQVAVQAGDELRATAGVPLQANAPPLFYQTPVPVSPQPAQPVPPHVSHANTGSGFDSSAPPAHANFAPPAAPRKSRAPLVVVIVVVGVLAALSVFGIGALLLFRGEAESGKGRSASANIAANRSRGAQNSATGNSANTSASVATDDGNAVRRVEEMILKDAVLSEKDLAGISTANLRFLRNTIYARHGRIFNTRELQGYFRSRPWYKPDAAYTDFELTANDRRSAALITAAETGAAASANADAGTARREIAAVLEGWTATTRARDLGAHMSFYADTLDTYYQKRGARSEQVASDRARAFARYTRLNITLNDVRITPDASGTRATATFNKTWEFEGERRSTGNVRQMVWLTKFGDRWLITGEKDLEVLSTGTQEYQ